METSQGYKEGDQRDTDSRGDPLKSVLAPLLFFCGMEAKLPSALMVEMLKDVQLSEDVLTSPSLCLVRKIKPEFAEDMALSAFLFHDTHSC